MAESLIRTALSSNDAEAEARPAVERIAMLAAAAALRDRTPEVADLFARAWLQDRQGRMFGTSDIGRDEARRLLQRALPAG